MEGTCNEFKGAGGDARLENKNNMRKKTKRRKKKMKIMVVMNISETARIVMQLNMIF